MHCVWLEHCACTHWSHVVELCEPVTELEDEQDGPLNGKKLVPLPLLLLLLLLPHATSAAAPSAAKIADTFQTLVFIGTLQKDLYDGSIRP